MDDSKRNIHNHIESASPEEEKEQEKILSHMWQAFVRRRENADSDDLKRIKARIDAFIDDYERKRMLSGNRWNIWGKIAAVIIPMLLLGMAAMFFTGRESDKRELNMASIVTANRERATVILPDGTEVTMNSDSRLSYSPYFTNDSIRSVTLSGEAYFNVSKDASHPFVVSIENLKVRVLGTSFNVKGRQDDSEVKVALIDGSVELVSPDRHVVLKPKEVAAYNRANNTFEIKSSGCHLATGWLSHQKSYVNIPPDSLIRIIESNYEFVFPDVVKRSIDDAFTGTLPDDNLNEALLILSEVYDFDVSKAGVNLPDRN